MRALRTLVCVSAVAIALALCGGGVHRTAAEAPAHTAWWSVAGASGGAPAPPDVKSGDLLVEGVGGPPPALPSAPAAPAPVPAPVPPPPAAPLPAPPAPPSGAPVPGAPGGGVPPGTLAVAALSFPVPDGAEVGPLSIGLDEQLKPLVVGIIACPITGPFAPVENGPLGDVPPFDCTTKDTPTLSSDGATLTFAHLGSMVRGGSLSVLLLPGAADRVVLGKPGAAALTVIPAPPEPPDDLGPLPAPPPTAASAAPPASAPVIAPVTAGLPPTPRHHHLRHRAAVPLATAPPTPAGKAPRVVLLATLAAIAAGALVLGRPSTVVAGSKGFHRFARARTGRAPRV